MKKNLSVFSLFLLLLCLSIHGKAQITVNAGADVSICAGASTTLNASVVGGTAPYTYAWAPATGLNDSTLQNPMASPSITTYYIVIVTDAVFLTATDTVLVTVNANPVITANNNSPVCEGASLNFTGTGALTYSWTGPNSFNSSATNPVIPAATFANNGTYTLNGTDANGCVATMTTSVMVMPSPTLTVNSSTVCAGSTATLTANGGNTYLWNTGSTLSSINVIPATSTNYTVTGTNGSGCTDTAVASVTVLANPVVVCNDPGMCTGSSATLTATGALTYAWSNLATTASTTVTPGSTTYYTVIGTDANGCTAEDTADVTVYSLPNVTGIGASTCSGVPVEISATGALTYVWAVGGTTDTITVSPTTTTGYTVTGTDANGCSNVGVAVVTVGGNSGYVGTVTYSGGAISNGTLYFIAQGVSSALYDTIATTGISLGNFSLMSGIPPGNYYIRAEANSGSYPTVVNTYYTNAYLWDSASVDTHGCGPSPDTVNIVMLEAPAISGPGTISGTVYEGIGFGQKVIMGPGNPVPYANVIPGVPVKVGKNPGGQLVASGTTDVNGQYTFNNLPIDNYKVYVDIPGYPMDSSYSISVTSTDTLFNNVSYVVDSNSVYIDMSIGVAEMNQAVAIHCFPNPVQDVFTLIYDLRADEHVQANLYTMQGENVASLVNENQDSGKHELKINSNQFNLSNGMYILRIVAGNKQKMLRLVISK